LYKRRFADATGISGPGPAGEAVLGDWLVSLINTMRADMDNDKLYPPGCVYIMVCDPAQRDLTVRNTTRYIALKAPHYNPLMPLRSRRKSTKPSCADANLSNFGSENVSQS